MDYKQAQNQYGGRKPGGQGNYYDDAEDENEPKVNATEQLLNNTGRQPGIGKRRFNPPTKQSGEATGFNPGKSVMNSMLNNKKKEGGQMELKDGSEEKKEMDPRYEGLDERLVQIIESEIMDKKQDITWNDIAGLERAKKIIHEVIVMPMLRPDLFKGIRQPPRGVLFFGPPGTGKTLLGKAIAA